MKYLVIALALFSSSCGVSVYNCTVGMEGVDDAVAFMERVIPDVTDILEIMCTPKESIQSSSSCGFGHSVEDRARIESCMMFVGSGPYPARILIDDTKDTALGVCHELQHARPIPWATDDMCQSHDMSCGYDQDMVKRCNAAVFEARGIVTE